jgi:hypothetical protein
VRVLAAPLCRCVSSLPVLSSRRLRGACQTRNQVWNILMKRIHVLLGRSCALRSDTPKSIDPRLLRSIRPTRARRPTDARSVAGKAGDEQDAGQGVQPVDMGAGILQGREGCHDFVQLASGARHYRPPARRSDPRHGGRYTRSGERAQARKVYRIVIKVRAGAMISPLTPGQGHQGRVQYFFR